MSESKTLQMDSKTLLKSPITWMIIGVIVMSIVMYFAQGLIVLFGGVVLGLYLYQNYAPEESKQQHDTEEITRISVTDYINPHMIQHVWGKISDKLTEGFQAERKPPENPRSRWRWWHTP